jgi:hypothetical protein
VIRYEILPGVRAIREKERLFREFGRDGCVFARPTSVHKLFVGRLIAEEDFETALAPTRYDSETRVVVAEPQVIRREWRLVVEGTDVIAATQYANRGVKSIERGCPEEVTDFARAILEHVRWRPDELFMLDVCQSKEGLKLVELNSFSCSWLYACDFAAVVEDASWIAARAWERARSGTTGTESIP